MPHKCYKLIVLLLTVLCFIVLGGSCLWYATRPIPVENTPPPALITTDTSLPIPNLAPVAEPPKPEPKPPAAPAMEQPRPPTGTECTRDLDCKGPKQADCVRPNCTNGKCVYNYSFCECRTNDDCDDGDPCTRNHCFLNTMKCVYIKDGCK